MSLNLKLVNPNDIIIGLNEEYELNHDKKIQELSKSPKNSSLSKKIILNNNYQNNDGNPINYLNSGNITPSDRLSDLQDNIYFEKINLGNGKFEYCCESKREMFQNAFQSITQTETWGFVKQDCESFMWSEDIRIIKISEKMEKLGYKGHSGYSFGYTMRYMQYLANHGEEEFKKKFSKIIVYPKTK
jgi:nanoRNase/pAp phosphatase (c-di-AMP/oligoRNAs hydrolase)